MRLSSILIPVALVLALLALAALPTGYAQPTEGTTAQYLPLVFKGGPTAVATRTSTATPLPSATPAPTPTDNPLNTHGRDLYNCSDFSRWSQAEAVYAANLPGDPNHLDADGDGIPCESLPGAP